MHKFTRLKTLPTYVFSYLEPLRRELQENGREVIDLAMGNPDLPPPEHALTQLRRYVNEIHRHRYGAKHGSEQLRASLAKWYQRRYQVEIDPERETVVTIGSKTGLAYLAFAIFSCEDTVLVPDPGYPIHHFGPLIADAKLACYSTLGDDVYQEIESQVAKTRPRAIILNSPSNPTTKIFDRTFFEKTVALAQKHQIYLINDLAYADIYFGAERPVSLLSIPGVKALSVESYTISKSYSLAGWRLGFISGCEDLVQALKQIKVYLDYGTFMPIELAAADILDEEEAYLEWVKTVYFERGQYVVERLTQMGWSPQIPEGTMFVWSKIPDFHPLANDSLEFVKSLLRSKGVVLSPGIGFGENGEGHIRISLILNSDEMKHAMDLLESWQHEVCHHDH